MMKGFKTCQEFVTIDLQTKNAAASEYLVLQSGWWFCQSYSIIENIDGTVPTYWLIRTRYSSTFGYLCHLFWTLRYICLGKSNPIHDIVILIWVGLSSSLPSNSHQDDITCLGSGIPIHLHLRRAFSTWILFQATGYKSKDRSRTK